MRSQVPEMLSSLLQWAGYLKAEGITSSASYFFRNPFCVIVERDQARIEVLENNVYSPAYTAHNIKSVPPDTWRLILYTTGCLTAAEATKNRSHESLRVIREYLETDGAPPINTIFNKSRHLQRRIKNPEQCTIQALPARRSLSC